MTAFLKIVLTIAFLCLSIWLLIPTKPTIVQEKPLKKSSFTWWPDEDPNFWAEGSWAYTFKKELKKRGYDFKIISNNNIDETTDYLLDSDIIIIGYPIKEGVKIPFDFFKKDVKIYV